MPYESGVIGYPPANSANLGKMQSKMNCHTIHAVPTGNLITDPNPPGEVTWHPFYEILQRAHARNPSIPRSLKYYPSKLPARPVCFVPFLRNGRSIDTVDPNEDLSAIFNDIDLDFSPGKYPINFYNICQSMVGDVSENMGADYKVMDGTATSRSPGFDLAFITRVVKWSDFVPKECFGIHNDPSKGDIIVEFDCPTEAWFFQPYGSNHTPNPLNYAHFPFSILMELALHTPGVLTSILRAPLAMKKGEVLLRNLDSWIETFEPLKKVDLRGKTILNRSVSKSFNVLGNMAVHKFSFEVYVKESKNDAANGRLHDYINNYERDHIDNNSIGCLFRGETSFCWFAPEVLQSQSGLDKDKRRDPSFMEDPALGATTVKFCSLNTPTGEAAFTMGDAIKRSLWRKTKQGQFVQEINISTSDDPRQQYVHGLQLVDPEAWYFSCHFWKDPVMPGSMGVEAMYQLMECYIINRELYRKIKGFKDDGSMQLSFRFDAGKMSYKYRGEVTPKTKKMDSEVFIQAVREVDGGQAIEIIANGNFFADNLRVYEITGIRLQVVGYPVLVQPKMRQTQEIISTAQLKQKLLDPTVLLNLTFKNDQIYELSGTLPSSGNFGTVFPISFADLGDKRFMEFYGVKANLHTGAMAKGIASADLVIAMAQNGFLATFGAGGLPMHVVEKALIKMKDALGDKPFAVNLIHSPFDPNLEEGNVDLFKKYGVNVVEASAFMDLTPSVVLYRASGLRLEGSKIIIGNKLIAKCSRTEVAEKFLRAAPVKILDKLLISAKITAEQHLAAQLIPLADDITIEADSGGHTDNRQIQVVLPLVINQRDRIFKETRASLLTGSTYTLGAKAYNDRTQSFVELELSWPLKPRIGAGGGIGCPEAALCAYSLGAAYLVTGSVNQLCRESGTCDAVRGYLSDATYADVTMAPAADMFEQGVNLQVLKKGTMFPSRAKKLYQLFSLYDSFEQMPTSEITNLEKRIFKKTIPEVWAETRDFYINRIKNPAKIDKVEVHGDTKLKMSLCFRWYLGLSSFWANSGDADRKTDYQIWCGPAIGAFNEFVRGSRLDVKVSGLFPSVVEANVEILKGAAYLSRVQQIKFNKNIGIDVSKDEISTYSPQ